MIKPSFKRIPEHIGFIPDGNRRWAQSKGLEKQDGYQYGLKPGFELYDLCVDLGVKEMTFYGFTQDNTKRPSMQTEAFTKACVDAVMQLAGRDADLLVIGNSDSSLFPKALLPFTKRVRFGRGLIKINFLVNYGWSWDLSTCISKGISPQTFTHDFLQKNIASRDISRIDLIIRWGGRRRLSGFLPVQSIYADFYILDSMWPDFKKTDLYEALEWYQDQDITLGG